MVFLVGVQSNQFPRALDLAKPLRERGIQVAIGGFHVSGTITMLDGNDAGSRRTPRRWAFRSSPAKPKDGSTKCCATPMPASSNRSTTSWTICRTSKGAPIPLLKRERVDAPRAR